MDAEEEEAAAEDVPAQLEDRIQANYVLRTSGRLRSFDVRAVPRECGVYEVLAAFTNNSVELHRMNIYKKDSTSTRQIALARQGHRHPLRALSISSDSALILSTSNSGAKLWNAASGKCLRSLDSDYGLSAVFAPGNRHVIVGTRSGHLQLFDLGSGSMLENIEAHTKAVWSLALSPDKQGRHSLAAQLACL